MACMCGAGDCRRCYGDGAVSNTSCPVCDYEYTHADLAEICGRPVPEYDCPVCSQPVDCAECGAELEDDERYTDDSGNAHCAACQAVIDDAQGG